MGMQWVNHSWRQQWMLCWQSTTAASTAEEALTWQRRLAPAPRGSRPRCCLWRRHQLADQGGAAGVWHHDPLLKHLTFLLAAVPEGGQESGRAAGHVEASESCSAAINQRMHQICPDSVAG